MCQHLHERTGHRMTPAEQCYEWLLKPAGIGAIPSRSIRRILLSHGFLPPLRIPIQMLLVRPRPLAQEAIGWEFLSAQFNIVVNASEEHVGFVSA